jgi:uncharacterized protein HemY
MFEVVINHLMSHQEIKVWMLVPFVFLSFAKLGIIFWLVVRIIKFQDRIDRLDETRRTFAEEAVKQILDKLDIPK